MTISDDLKGKATVLREEGKTYKEIATALDISETWCVENLKGVDKGHVVELNKELLDRIAAYTIHLQSGLTHSEIATMYGISRQRVSGFLCKHIPNWRDLVPRDEFLYEKRSRESAERKEIKLKEFANVDEEMRKVVAKVFARKKQNAKSTKWGWNISVSDLVWNKYCPYLGIELDYSCPKRSENSVSLDRLDSTKGYIVGNVVVCSWRGNRIKNDATIEELGLLYHNLKSLLGN